MSDPEWTAETLKVLLDERYQTQTRAVEAALAAQQKAMETAFAAANAALDQRATTLDREFHEHLEQVRHENALAFKNSDKAIQAAFNASDKAIQAALSAAEKAVNKAEMATEKRFESVNEFRAQLTDQTASFLPRREYDTAHDALEAQVNELRDRINRTEGKSGGYAALYGWIVAALGIIISVVVLANALIGQ